MYHIENVFGGLVPLIIHNDKDDTPNTIEGTSVEDKREALR